MGLNPAQTRCTQYNIMWQTLPVTYYMSVVFSTNKTDHHDITELLLKVVLNTINQTIKIVVECLVDSISVMTRTRSTNNTSAYMIRRQDWDWPMFWSFNWQVRGGVIGLENADETSKIIQRTTTRSFEYSFFFFIYIFRSNSTLIQHRNTIFIFSKTFLTKFLMTHFQCVKTSM